MLGRRRWDDAIDVSHAGRFSPRAVRVIGDIVEPVVRRVFRPRLDGVEHLPRTGPFILVANHSAGLGIAEGLSFAALYLRQMGADRPLAALALPTDFSVPVMRDVMTSLGAIPSTRAAASASLRAGVPLLVFPGAISEGRADPYGHHDRHVRRRRPPRREGVVCRSDRRAHKTGSTLRSTTTTRMPVTAPNPASGLSAST